MILYRHGTCAACHAIADLAGLVLPAVDFCQYATQCKHAQLAPCSCPLILLWQDMVKLQVASTTWRKVRDTALFCVLGQRTLK